MKAVVLFSGGQDSTTCLAWAVDRWGKDEVQPISFDYSQKHQVELEQAKKICEKLGVAEPVVLPIEALAQLSAAALTNPDIEVEAEAQQHGEDTTNIWAAQHGLPSTFVPGRNLLFLTLAAAYGAMNGAKELVTGVCEADAAGYPDCRKSFVMATRVALSEALADDFIIWAPLISINKAATFQLAEDLGVLDTVVEMSHTCYHGERETKHDWGYGCGECPACQERANGWSEFKEMEAASA